MKTKHTREKDKNSSRLEQKQEVKKGNSTKRAMVPDNTVQKKQVNAIENNSVLPVQQQKLDAMFNGTLQREKNPEEDKLLQGKFSETTTMQQLKDEEELPGQGKFSAKAAQMIKDEEEKPPLQEKPNNTGMPASVKAKMENSFNTDFSSVKVHANSSKAPGVGALAYTQGTDIHFAPGQFSPDTKAGQKLIGHELAHVVQQQQGRVVPTTEIGGMPVNDNPGLENEADKLGDKASE